MYKIPKSVLRSDFQRLQSQIAMVLPKGLFCLGISQGSSVEVSWQLQGGPLTWLFRLLLQ